VVVSSPPPLAHGALASVDVSVPDKLVSTPVLPLSVVVSVEVVEPDVGAEVVVEVYESALLSVVVVVDEPEELLTPVLPDVVVVDADTEPVVVTPVLPLTAAVSVEPDVVVVVVDV